jgi:hypothetical protein
VPPKVGRGIRMAEATFANPTIAFLGFAERALQVRDGNTAAVKWNVLGLKRVILTYFVPLPWLGFSSGWHFVP